MSPGIAESGLLPVRDQAELVTRIKQALLDVSFFQSCARGADQVGNCNQRPRSVMRAVKAATSIPDWPAYRDFTLKL